jgi:hypothetical protein
MTLKRRLKAIFDEVLTEAESNPAFAERLRVALGEAEPIPPKRGRRRRTPALLDPVKVLESEGEVTLRDRLGTLDIEQLKDIVAEYGMDQAKLVMKWNTASRIADHIVTTAVHRAKKGDAFR